MNVDALSQKLLDVIGALIDERIADLSSNEDDGTDEDLREQFSMTCAKVFVRDLIAGLEA